MKAHDLAGKEQDLHTTFKEEAIALLQQLIAIPSFSRAENGTADLLEQFLQHKNIKVQRTHNNIWCSNKFFDPAKPTILLNSHHDTVKPNAGYTHDPFEAFVKEGKLFGLGSNDAGGPLVSLIAVFLFFYEKQHLKYNFILLASAEEEISGTNGVACLIDELPKIDFAIVGEPTHMDMAIAEKGLMVLDCQVKGRAGHAARDEGDNAIYKALACIHWFSSFRFPKRSEMLGDVKMSVTVIKAGEQHNVVPALCAFTVDVRTTEVYTNEEVFGIIQKHVPCEIQARSFRLQPSKIDKTHPFVEAGIAMGRKTYGSPTMSDQALMPWPSLKMGPGDSARSHTADEFIYIAEIYEAIDIYIELLQTLNENENNTLGKRTY